MRRYYVSIIVALAGILGIFGIANAATFDGQDMSPEYMTGITEVSAVTGSGQQILIPVWSLEPCMHEDGSQRVGDCIWVGSQRGNLQGQSMAYIGNDYVWLTNYAAEILVTNSYVSTPPANSAPVIYNDSIPTPETQALAESQGYDWTYGLPPCEFEDQNGCYWNAQTMGNGMGQSFAAMHDGTVVYK